MPDFYERVYEIVALIPLGRVTTYGAIANCLGSAKSSRLVGVAMNHSHLTHPDLPAHRVVNRSGLLTGRDHFTNIPMQELLESEGIVVVDEQVQQFNTIFWDPKDHL
jgi:methylated-DNA-protein-cysteine methyltransferase-like protein